MQRMGSLTWTSAETGRKSLNGCEKENPAGYFKGLLSLLPKVVSLRDTNKANT
jgi:hypothetical protein